MNTAIAEQEKNEITATNALNPYWSSFKNKFPNDSATPIKKLGSNSRISFLTSGFMRLKFVPVRRENLFRATALWTAAALCRFRARDDFAKWQRAAAVQNLAGHRIV